MSDDRKDRKPETDKDDEESRGQYGGLEHGIGPGGGSGFEEVERPARSEAERQEREKK